MKTALTFKINNSKKFELFLFLTNSKILNSLLLFLLFLNHSWKQSQISNNNIRVILSCGLISFMKTALSYSSGLNIKINKSNKLKLFYFALNS